MKKLMALSIVLVCLLLVCLYKNIRATVDIQLFHGTVMIIDETEKKMEAGDLLPDEALSYISAYYPNDTRIQNRKLIEVQEMVRKGALDRIKKAQLPLEHR